ncbi:MAG: hypothetical protein KA230_10900, partial [Flavobacteriales bacterium]|nr:hypothetical protein [Flavobacteriales bacterium]
FGYNDVSGSGWYSTVLNGEVVFTAVALASIEIWTATNGYGFGLNDTSGSGWYGTTFTAPPVGSQSTR